MAFLPAADLARIGFKSLGKNVQISDKAIFYNPERIEIGDHSRIDDLGVISGTVAIGRNVHLGVFCHIAGGTEGVAIGDFSGVSYGAHIFSQSDDYTGTALIGSTVPRRFRKETRKAVRLGRHCIVGAGSIVLPGVALAEGTAVGAMALVTRSTEAWSIYAGIPAKKIRSRERGLLDLEREYLASET